MRAAPSRLSWMAVAVVVSSPLVAPAGEAHRKAVVAKPGKAEQAVAAAEQRAMLHQQAALQRQAVAQNHIAAQRQAEANGVHPHPNANYLAHRGGTAYRGNGVNHNANTGAMVSSLHSVVAKLHQADHDYDGHRVQAIHQLDQAIHTLHNGTNGTNVGTGTGTGGHANGTRVNGNGNGTGTGTGTSKTSRMSQAESDNHLRQAHHELQALEGRMAIVGTGAPAHHQQAHTHVRQALEHLNTALATR